MTRARWFVILAAVAAGCSGGSEKPGALLHGPGALAVFNGIVAHDSGSLRPYLAVANERGDDLRLIDTTDNEVVTSPGLVFPLSVPTGGRPMLLAASDLKDGLPDALAVVSSGSSVVELVDTWSGAPTVGWSRDPLVLDSVDLSTLEDPTVPATALGNVEVLSLVATPEPDVVISPKARFVVGIVSPTGSKLVVIRVQRKSNDGTYEVLDASVLALTFAPVGLAAGTAPGVVYAATRDPLPGAFHGVAKISLPAALTGWSVTALDALVPTDAVAVARSRKWNTVSSTFDLVDRVIAVPVGGQCGAATVPCGLIAIDPDSTWEAGRGNLAYAKADHSAVDGKLYLPPIPVNGFVAGLIAVGRNDGTVLSIVSASGTETTALAVVSSTDGAVYLVDVDRWTMVGATNPLEGGGETGVSAVAVVAGTGSRIGLWPLYGDPATAANVSASVDELKKRVRITPGFTPDDTWTLSYQGILPDLDTRDAQVSWTGTPKALTVTVPGMSLASRGVTTGDEVTISVGPAAGDTPKILRFKACLDGRALAVGSLDAGAATLVLPDCPDSSAPPFSVADPFSISTVEAFTNHPAVTTFRAGGLVLVGRAWGYVGRPLAIGSAPTDTTGEFPVAGTRLFYLTGSCGDNTTTCLDKWEAPPYALTFPFPSGPALGLTPGYVDAAGNPTPTPPSRDTALTFTTKSGFVVPSGRRPIVKGTALASELPTGLALVDGGASGTGAEVYTSYTAGVLMRFSTAAATGSMAVIR